MASFALLFDLDVLHGKFRIVVYFPIGFIPLLIVLLSTICNQLLTKLRPGLRAGRLKKRQQPAGSALNSCLRDCTCMQYILVSLYVLDFK